MANKFPLIIDTDNGNRISELPAGDNLDLTGSGIINAASISVNGSITTSSITINGQSLSAVAFSNNFEDLDNVPVGFSGDYNDLINKPTPVVTTWDLEDILGVEPNNGDILRYNTLNGLWEPEALVQDFDLSGKTLQDIGNVIATGDITNKYLKYYAGAWRAANVTYAEVQNAPTKLSELINDVGYITTQGEDSQTLSFDGNNLTISNGNTVDITQTISYDGSSLTLSNSNTVDTGAVDAIFRTLRTVEGIDNSKVIGELSWTGAGNDAQTKIYANNSKIEIPAIATDELDLLRSTGSTGIRLKTVTDQAIFSNYSQLTISHPSSALPAHVKIIGGTYTDGFGDEQRTELSLGGISDFPETLDPIQPAGKGQIWRLTSGYFETLDTDNLIINVDVALKGNLVSDDSTLLIDGATGTIPGYVSIAELKNIASTSATYADFQAAIAAL